MDSYAIIIHLQLLAEKEGYQTDYPYWRMMNIHWLMGHYFFFIIPSTRVNNVFLCCHGVCSVSVLYPLEIPNLVVQYFNWDTELCTKFKLWATRFAHDFWMLFFTLLIARYQGKMFNLWPSSETWTKPLGPSGPHGLTGSLASTWAPWIPLDLGWLTKVFPEWPSWWQHHMFKNRFWYPIFHQWNGVRRYLGM